MEDSGTPVSTGTSNSRENSDQLSYQIINEKLIADAFSRNLEVTIKNTGKEPIDLFLDYSIKYSDGTSETKTLLFYSIQPGDITKSETYVCSNDEDVVSFKLIKHLYF